MAYEIQPEGTFRGLVELRSAGWMRGEFSAAFFQIILGVPADQAAQALATIVRMHLLDDPQSPDDILPILGADRRLPAYSSESAAAHRRRLIDAWNIHALGGSHTSIEDQFLAAGYGPSELIETWGASGHTWGETGDLAWGDRGCAVEFRDYEPGPRGEPAPYATQFWITVGNGYHPVAGPPTPWGSFVWGDPTGWSPIGYTPEYRGIVNSIVEKWKSVRYVFRGFRFMVGAELFWGDSSITWGTSDTVWGGAIDVTRFY